MSELKLTADESDLIKALDNVEKKLAETGQQATATGKAVGTAFSDSGEDTRRATAALDAYRASQEKLAASTDQRLAKHKQMKEALEANRKAQEQLNAQSDQTAKKTVDLSAQIKKAAEATKEHASASDDAAKSGGALSGVIGSTPWGRVALAIGGVVTFLSKFQEGMDFVNRVTAAVSAAMTALVSEVANVGKALYALVTLDFEEFERLNKIIGVGGLAKAMSDAASTAFGLEGRMQKLRDAQLDASVSTAKLAAASERAQAVSQQESKTFDERIGALRRAIALEEEIAKKRVGFAEQDAALAREAFDISAKGVSDKEALIAKELAVVNARNEADKTRIELLGRLTELEKQRAEFIAKNLEAVEKALSKLNLALESDPIERELIAVRQKYEGLTKLAEDSLKKLVEVEKLRPLNSDEIAQRQALQDALVDITEKAADAEIAALLEGLKKQSEIEDAKVRAKEAAAKKQNDVARTALQEALELQNQQIDITEAEFDNLIATLRAKGVEEAEVKKAQNEFDRRIKAARINAEIQYQKGLLELVGNGTEADIIRARIQELGVLLEGLEIPEPKAKDGKPKSIYDILGIKFDDPEQQAAFEQAVARISDSLSQLAEARVKEAEAATRAAQDKVDAAEDALEKEQEFLKQGLANNTDLRRKELEEAKKARDLALKEEAKARRAQILLDSVSQASGLVTSASNIFSSLSKIPFVGIPLAIATIGLMFAAFAKTKADAFKAASPPKLRKGDKIVGRTHEQGGEIRELEHGEQVVGARESAGQDLFFERMRKGQYRGLDLAAIADGRSDRESPLHATASRTEALRARRELATEQAHYKALANAYEKVGGEIVAAIKTRPQYAPWKNGYKKVVQTGHGTDTLTVVPSE